MLRSVTLIILTLTLTLTVLLLSPLMAQQTPGVHPESKGEPLPPNWCKDLPRPAGPIFLYVPETDLAAYQRTVDRLANLVPGLDAVLPSHNYPLEKPEMLVRVADAFRKVREGKVRPTESEGMKQYDFSSFSFLLAR